MRAFIAELDWKTLYELTVLGFFGVGACLYVLAIFGQLIFTKRGETMGSKLSAETRELVEDIIVNGLDAALEDGVIDMDAAYAVYAQIAHAGFWGLHPKRNYSALNPAILKEQLRERLKLSEPEGLTEALEKAFATNS